MKLKDWADKQGISYLTAWRWFKAGDPRLADAYQSDSGTIIVPDESDTSEPTMLGNTSNDVMSTVLKKTVEFSKSNASVEDFAAWILSNYSLKPHSQSEGPKYSRNKPKPEEVQKHFQQFLKPKGEKPKTNMFVAPPEVLDDLVTQSNDLTAQELVDQIEKVGVEVGTPINPTNAPEVEDLMKDLTSAIQMSPNVALNSVTTYDSVAGGVVARSVDLTPQQLNYTGSTSGLTSSNFCLSDAPANAASGTYLTNSAYLSSVSGGSLLAQPAVAFAGGSTFQSPQPEVQPVIEKPKRGRKPSKGKK